MNQQRYINCDICENRHKNAPESVAAKPTEKETARQRARVLAAIQQRGSEGATSEEVADELGVTVNRVSGRLSELKALEQIEKAGTRPTRTGKSAGVFVAK